MYLWTQGVNKGSKDFLLHWDDFWTIGGRIYVSKMVESIRLYLEEAYCSQYIIHPSMKNMYHDLILENYWWCCMRRDTIDFFSRCLTFHWF